MRKKRGQISIFLVVAIIIILLGIAYFSSQKVGNNLRFKERINPKFEPVKAFVDECLKKTADEGLEKIGLTGGYINYPARLANPRSFYSPVIGSGFKYPYWWFDGNSAMPSLELMKVQLEDYIKSNALTCIDDFREFDEGYAVTPEGGFDAQVFINDADVEVFADYPVRALLKSGNIYEDISQYSYKTPVRLKKAYELAKRIMEQENNDYFIEYLTIDILTMSPKDIPVDDVAISCGSKTWNINDVKSRFSELLSSNLPYLKVSGTDFSRDIFVSNPCATDEFRNSDYCKGAGKQENTFSSTYYNEHFVWNVDNNAGEKYNGMGTAFRMAGNFERFDAKPRSGQLLKSNSQPMQSALKFLCINMWHFTYDISYPVLATIYDKPSDKNKEFLFNFAFKVDIKDNRPNRENKGGIVFESSDYQSDEDYCKDTAKGAISINTESSGLAVDEAELRFECGQYACELGKTEISPLHNLAGIAVNLPRCGSGTITASKDGFLEGTAENAVSDNNDRSYFIELRKLKSFPECIEINKDGACVKSTSLRVKKHALKTPFETSSPSSSAVELSQDETAAIFIKDKNSDFESYALYPAEKDSNPLSLLEDQTIIYDVDIYVNRGDEFVGSYKGEWKADISKLSSAEEIVFHAVTMDIPASMSDDNKNREISLFLDKIETYSSKIPQPELK